MAESEYNLRSKSKTAKRDDMHWQPPMIADKKGNLTRQEDSDSSIQPASAEAQITGGQVQYTPGKNRNITQQHRSFTENTLTPPPGQLPDIGPDIFDEEELSMEQIKEFMASTPIDNSPMEREAEYQAIQMAGRERSFIQQDTPNTEVSEQPHFVLSKPSTPSTAEDDSFLGAYHPPSITLQPRKLTTRMPPHQHTNHRHYHCPLDQNLTRHHLPPPIPSH